MYDDFLTRILLPCLLARDLYRSNQWICNRVGLQRLCLQPWAIRTTSRDLFDPFSECSDIIENQQMTFSCSSTQNFNWILIPLTMIKMAKTKSFFNYRPLWVTFFNLVKNFNLFASNELKIWLSRVIFGCLMYFKGLRLLPRWYGV